jgi:hypothetical protein
MRTCTTQRCEECGASIGPLERWVITLSNRTLCGRCGDKYLDAVERVKLLGEALAQVELEQLENDTISTQKKKVCKT